MASTPEGRVKAAIEKWLKSNGFVKAGHLPDGVGLISGWYYMPVAMPMGVHGIPDFCGIWRGRPFYIEAKAPGKTATDNQRERHREAHQ